MCCFFVTSQTQFKARCFRMWLTEEWMSHFRSVCTLRASRNTNGKSQSETNGNWKKDVRIWWKETWTVRLAVSILHSRLNLSARWNLQRVSDMCILQRFAHKTLFCRKKKNFSCWKPPPTKGWSAICASSCGRLVPKALTCVGGALRPNLWLALSRSPCIITPPPTHAQKKIPQ